MAKQSKDVSEFLRWTKNVPVSDVQDPLGTSLRGSVRLASLLLYCVTSITPRARYFSFVPWCVFDFQKRERGTLASPGLSKGMVYREHALTLGCVVQHDGARYPGGTLVGSLGAIRWYRNAKGEEADFKRLSFVQNPAYNAYFASLVNLGMFVTDDELPDTDEDAEIQRTFDDIELSPLGLELAGAYDSVVHDLAAIRQIASPERQCEVNALVQLGVKGGLCELAESSAPDRQILRDVFFRRRLLKGDAHFTRRHSLLLLLQLCAELKHVKVAFNQSTFADSVYFGEVRSNDGVVPLSIPSSLQDIASRWRMFYFHYYMAVALEGMFSWLVAEVTEAGLAGKTLEELVTRLDQKTVRVDVGALLGIKIGGSVGELTPAQLFENLSVPAGPLDNKLSSELDRLLRSDSVVAEPEMEQFLRKRTHLRSATGLAIPLILLVLTLGRYRRWEETDYGNWLARVAYDPYMDLVPPVLIDGLQRRVGDWWHTPMRSIATVTIQRYIVQQHQSMSFEKSASGSRCLLQVDGPRICGVGGTYDKIGITNGRFGSGVQVLVDLGLMCWDDEAKTYDLTKDGHSFLEQELSVEAGSK